MAAGDPEFLLQGAPVPRRASLPRAFLVVAPAMAAANALNYAFNLAMSRLLGPADYGALGALLALVLVEVFWSIGMIAFETLMPVRLAG